MKENFLTFSGTKFEFGFVESAHIAGAAGKRVATGIVNTIIGLDPAGPLFDADSPANRLDRFDAMYVEAIHTDIVQLGIGYPIGKELNLSNLLRIFEFLLPGDADFYPNGGSGMPGCLSELNSKNFKSFCLTILNFSRNLRPQPGHSLFRVQPQLRPTLGPWLR